MQSSIRLVPELTGQVALVTGASRGIGRAIAHALAACGATVVLTARTAGQLERVRGEIADAGGSADAVAADLDDEDSVASVFDHIREQFGQLDILINNAGVGVFGPIRDFSAQDFERVLTTNVCGTFLCCREAMRLMVPQKRGYIMNIASVTGIKAYANQGAYSASKHAVMGLTKSLSLEAQPQGIRVSAILPGGVDTEMISDARPDLDRSTLMHPDDVAQTVLYLLSLSGRAAVDQIYIRRRTSTPF
jgi:3-oxoacyl-[acyl-carrier protein] reductase